MVASISCLPGVWPITNIFLAVYGGISELFWLNLQFSLLDILVIINHTQSACCLNDETGK